jgi:hypothetical protein
MQQRKRRMRLLSPTDPVEQRYFTELSAAGGQHYTIPSVTIGASDDFELEFTGTFSPSGAYLLGNNTSSSVNDRVLYQSNRDFWFGNQVRFNMPIAAFASLTDGRLHVLTIIRTNLIYSVILDGVNISIASLDRAELDASFSRIARRPEISTGVPDFNGYLSDTKISINGTLIRHYPLDDDGETTLARELVSGADGARVNLTQASTEMFTKVGGYWGTGYEIDKSIGEPPYLRNLLQWSADFSKSVWTKVGLTIDGDTLIESNANEEHFLVQVVNVPSGFIYFTFEAKPAGRTVVSTRRANPVTDNDIVSFDLANGTVNVLVGVNGGELELLDDGWVKCKALLSSPVGGSSATRLFIGDVVARQGDGVSGVRLRKMQYEILNRTPYQATTIPKVLEIAQ